MIGRYNSSIGFVETNGLQEEANKLWGEGWEPCDDVYQVEELLNAIHPNKYLVSFLENVKEDDILVTEYNGVTPEQVKDTATNIIRLAKRLEHLPIHQHDSICHEINKLLKLD